MRILILTNNDAGLYLFRRELLEQFLEQGHEVYLSLPGGERVPALTAMGCRFIDTAFDRHGVNPFADLKLMQRYRRMIDEIKPQVVLTYTIKPNLYGGMACAAKRIPYIENITGTGVALEHPGLMQKLLLLMYRYALRRVKAVFFQNSGNREFFQSHKLAVGKDRLLPGSGVNLERFSVLPYPPDGETHFVFVARIMKEKGIEQYLDAAENLHVKYPNTFFHICGGYDDTSYQARIEQLTQAGAIVYHGFVTDMEQVYRTMHCIVHPTFFEGMSNVLLESSACGRPAIATNCCGCREIVDDGQNGFLCRREDSADLIAQIEKFLALPYEKKREMGLCGRRKVEKEFDRRIILRAYQQEIDSLFDR